MGSIVMDVESLPQHIENVFQTKKVAVQERENGIFIMSIPDSSGLFGIAANDKLTLETFMSYKREDNEIEG